MLSDSEVRVLDQLVDKDMPVWCDEPDGPGELAGIGGITIPEGTLLRETVDESKEVKMHKRVWDVGEFRVIEWVEMSREADGRIAVSVHTEDVY